MTIRKTTESICELCNNSFIHRTDHKQKYCNARCFGLALRIKKQQVVKECPVCHNNFIGKSHQKTQLCCSNKCSGVYRSKKEEMFCEICGKMVLRRQKQTRNHVLCSRGCLTKHKSMMADQKRKDGIKPILMNGYNFSLVGVNKYVAEHRLIMESHIGRKLDSSEIVHHVNENKLDSSIGNLAIITRADHVHIHKPRRGKKICKK